MMTNEMKEVLADEKLRNLLAYVLNENIQNLLKRKRLAKWNRGVYKYAIELLENLRCSQNGKDFFDYLLNDCFRYARCGRFQTDKLFTACRNYSNECSLIYDEDICERLSTASERKIQTRKDGTLGRPNAQEKWIDVQARAIFQACLKLNNLSERLAKTLISK